MLKARMFLPGDTVVMVNCYVMHFDTSWTKLKYRDAPLPFVKNLREYPKISEHSHLPSACRLLSDVSHVLY